MWRKKVAGTPVLCALCQSDLVQSTNSPPHPDVFSVDISGPSWVRLVVTKKLITGRAGQDCVRQRQVWWTLGYKYPGGGEWLVTALWLGSDNCQASWQFLLDVNFYYTLNTSTNGVRLVASPAGWLIISRLPGSHHQKSAVSTSGPVIYHQSRAVRMETCTVLTPGEYQVYWMQRNKFYVLNFIEEIGQVKLFLNHDWNINQKWRWYIRICFIPIFFSWKKRLVIFKLELADGANITLSQELQSNGKLESGTISSIFSL